MRSKVITVFLVTVLSGLAAVFPASPAASQTPEDDYGTAVFGVS